MRVNGGFFVFRPRDLRVDEGGRGAGPGALPAAGRGREAALATTTTASGPAWTPSRRSSSSRTSTPAGQVPWEVWKATPRRTDRPAARAPDDAATVAVRRAGSGPGGSSPSGRTADDIEIGCGGTLLRLLSERPDLEVTWVVFCSTPERAREARGLGGGVPGGRRAARGSSIKSHRDGFLPHRAGPGEGGVRGAEARGLAGSDPHPLPRRPAPGPPARLRADLEHLAEPPDPRVRDPEVRRRLRDPQPLRPPERRRPWSGRSPWSWSAFPTQAGKAWFTADLFRAVARIRGMECAGAGAAGRGVLLPEAGRLISASPEARAGPAPAASTAGSTRSSQHSRQ